MTDLMHRLAANVILAAAVCLLPQWCCSAETVRKPSSNNAQRTAWTTSQIVGSPDPTSPYRVEKAFPHLQFEQPTVLTTAPGDSRWYVAELTGKIFTFRNDAAVTQDEADLFIDLTRHIERVQHIYGMTFHPAFQQNGYVYICYLQGKGFSGDDRVSRFKVIGNDPPRCDPSSEQLLLKWPTGGHNGCCLKFGPDGYLYVSTGDGASPSPPDPYDTGQDISDFKSSILRIDVDQCENGNPYAIPPGNPFVDRKDARPEVWAYGFRNPWKMSFDTASGDLWVGDIGWDMWEMVFRVERGSNCGWSLVEGGQPIRTDLEPGPTPVATPVAIHPRSEFRSITGGYVYRGQAFPELEGAYLYGDYVTGQLWGLRYDGEQVIWQQQLVETRFPIIAFAVDHQGELYVVDYGNRRPGNREEGGSIYRLAANDVTEANLNFPQTLSDTGLFASVSDQEWASGVVPYEVNAEPWSDGATSERSVAIPGREQLGIYRENQLLLGQRQGAWSFPANSVLVKTLSLPLVSPEGSESIRPQPIETQILHKDRDIWRAYTYAWNDDATDAQLVPAEGSQRTFHVADSTAPGGSREQTWHFSARNECLVCHNTRAGVVLGFTPQQLDREETSSPGTSQLAAMGELGLFADELPPVEPRFVSPADTHSSLEQRARAYLDVNCGHCHGNGGGGTAQFRLQHDLPLEETGLLGSLSTQGDFGIVEARIVAPGDPYRSLLYYRMAKLGRGRMPHIGSHALDESALRLVHDWIRELAPSSDLSPSPSSELAALRSQQHASLRQLTSENRSDADDPLNRLLKTPSGGLLVQRELLLGACSHAVGDRILSCAGEVANPHVRELFEHFLPEEQRSQTAEINPNYVLTLDGDAHRGRQLFFSDTRLQCRKCHQVDKQGAAIGPDLTRIGGKYAPQELLTSLLAPSQKIDPAYVPWLVLTKEGTVHSGLLIKRTAEGVVLHDSAGKQITIPADDIEEMIAQDKSLMPVDALRGMTPKDAADLLAFLKSLK